MKIICKFIPLLLVLNTLALSKRELDTPYDIYSDVESDYLMNSLEINDRESFIEQIKVSKSLLLNGEADDAILILNKLKLTNKEFKKAQMVNRFLAIANFSKGDLRQVDNILTNEAETASWIYKNCFLRMSTDFSTKRKNVIEFNSSVDQCVRQYLGVNTNINKTWPEIIKILYKEKKLSRDYINKKLISNQTGALRTILKYGLFFRDEKRINQNYTKIPLEYFSDEEIRTLIAANLYNSGKKDLSIKLISSLSNSNANIIKAYSEFDKGNYKGAFAHFISNILSKPYSLTNNKLIVASAWLSGDYKSAREALSKIPVDKSLEREKDLLKTNLLLKEGLKREANFLMKTLEIKYNGKLPYEASIISTYLKLINGDKNWSKQADTSCLLKNAISCWLYKQSLIWQDYSKMISLGNVKNKSMGLQEKLNSLIVKDDSRIVNEANFIHQQDVYELDLVENPELQY